MRRSVYDEAAVGLANYRRLFFVFGFGFVFGFLVVLTSTFLSFHFRLRFSAACYTAGEIDVMRKSSIFIAGTSAVPGVS